MIKRPDTKAQRINMVLGVCHLNKVLMVNNHLIILGVFRLSIMLKIGRAHV